MKIGFIGCGGVAQWAHFKRLGKIPDVEITALHDISPKQMASAQKRFPGAKTYESPEALAEQSGVDAVYICLPPMAHGAAELAVARKGLPMFIEKPIANTLNTARKVRDAMRAGDVLCSVGYHWRYSDLTAKGRSFLAGRKVQLALGWWMGGMPGGPGHWWLSKDQSGGQIVEQTTHIVDLARCYLGEVKRVHAAGIRGGRSDKSGYDVEDASVANLEFESGTVCNIASTCLLDGTAGRVGLTLIGEKFMLEHMDGLKIHLPGEVQEQHSREDAYVTEDKVFIEAVRTKNASGILSTYEDAFKTLAVTLAANESMQTGKVVNVE